MKENLLTNQVVLAVSALFRRLPSSPFMKQNVMGWLRLSPA